MNTISNSKNQINIPINKEVALLRSFIIGIAGKDKEGQYKPAYVKRVLDSLMEKPTHSYKNKADFLESIS